MATTAMAQTLLGRLRLATFGISPLEARFERRGFPATTPDRQERLEGAGRSFIHGYCAALSSADGRQAAVACESIAHEMRGFAYEGAAMGLALLDLVSGGRPRLFNSFIAGPAQRHIYMAHVGAGWAIARCPWGLVTFLR